MNEAGQNVAKHPLYVFKNKLVGKNHFSIPYSRGSLYRILLNLPIFFSATSPLRFSVSIQLTLDRVISTSPVNNIIVIHANFGWFVGLPLFLISNGLINRKNHLKKWLSNLYDLTSRLM
jgi:hypothetical protein